MALTETKTHLHAIKRFHLVIEIEEIDRRYWSTNIHIDKEDKLHCIRAHVNKPQKAREQIEDFGGIYGILIHSSPRSQASSIQICHKENSQCVNTWLFALAGLFTKKSKCYEECVCLCMCMCVIFFACV